MKSAYHKSLMYYIPFIYRLTMLLGMSGKSYKKEMERVAEIVGERKVVFDVGCGLGILSQYLDRSCKYSGIDLNPDFVRDCKERGLRVKLGNFFEEKNYPNMTDFIVIAHTLHHITPREKELVSLAIRHARKVIIVEERFTDKKSSFLKRALENVLYSPWIFNHIGDADGINNPSQIHSWRKTEQELIDLFRQWGGETFTLEKNLRPGRQSAGHKSTSLQLGKFPFAGFCY